ncbi:MAG: D-tyrosyl-tRNA(Tyr) deacylase [Ignavibacteriae bacterium]|nr:MAG: D-tyrosyl-tRNA(Tyr) deacylase [Ignavibacteriota bacterium]
MKCVIQRVSRASVTVDDAIVGSINHGLLVLVGITHADTNDQAAWMADKILTLRVFADDEGKMNRSVKDVSGGVLLVSQFTLYGDLKKGTRPSFIAAARPEQAQPLFDHLVDLVRLGAEPNVDVATGTFGAMMDVELVNDGPVTIVVER